MEENSSGSINNIVAMVYTLQFTTLEERERQKGEREKTLTNMMMKEQWMKYMRVIHKEVREEYFMSHVPWSSWMEERQK